MCSHMYSYRHLRTNSIKWIAYCIFQKVSDTAVEIMEEGLAQFRESKNHACIIVNYHGRHLCSCNISNEKTRKDKLG